MERRDERIVAHVGAIEILLGRSVLAVIAQEGSGEVIIITPDSVALDVADVLQHLNWREAYERIASDKQRQ